MSLSVVFIQKQYPCVVWCCAYTVVDNWVLCNKILLHVQSLYKKESRTFVSYLFVGIMQFLLDQTDQRFTQSVLFDEVVVTQ